MSGKNLKGCFKKYLSKRFYDNKIKEFHELKMGSMTMDGLVKKIFELLHYVPYIKEEKIKIQRFLRCLPTYFVNKIEFDTPKTLNEALYKAGLCYEHRQSRLENKDRNKNIKISYS